MVRTELSLDTCSKIRGFGASPKGIENGSQNAIKKPSKSTLGTPGGLTFVFLMAFGRGVFLDGFSGA